MPDVPPPSLRFYKPSRTMFWPKNSDEPIRPTLDIETYEVLRHRVVGLSVMIAYWPESWQDEWAIEELLKWEGREDEIRRDQYYADFIVDANQQARSALIIENVLPDGSKETLIQDLRIQQMSYDINLFDPGRMTIEGYLGPSRAFTQPSPFDDQKEIESGQLAIASNEEPDEIVVEFDE